MTALLVGLYGCFEIVSVDQPSQVEQGESFVITMEATSSENDDIDIKYGILGIMLPIDFDVDSVSYTANNGEGWFYRLENDSTSRYEGTGGIKTGWVDSMASKFGVENGYKWLVYEMEEAYEAVPEFNEYEVKIYAKAGTTIGNYSLSYVITESSYDLEPVDADNIPFDFKEGFEIEVVQGTPIREDRPDLPSEVTLDQNYPNPFNPSTTISYSLPTDSQVSLVVVDVTGRVVRNLVDTRQQAGNYLVNVDMAGLSSGVYLYRLNVDGRMLTRSMTLVK